MQRLSFLLLSLCLLLVPSSTASAVSRHTLVTPSQFRQALWVHHCEEAAYGWHVDGPMYFGGLGWRPATWTTFRASWMPTSAALATPQEQAWALMRFIKRYGAMDTNGTCQGY